MEKYQLNGTVILGKKKDTNWLIYKTTIRSIDYTIE